MEDFTLNCGKPGDYGHDLLQMLQTEVDVLNMYAGLLRTEGFPWPGLSQIVCRALLGDDSGRRRFHTHLLKCDSHADEPVSINRVAFWHAYASTVDGQRAKLEAMCDPGKAFGEYMD